MIKRSDVIKNIANEQDKIQIVKIIDLADQVKKFYEPKFTQFLDPAQIIEAKKVLDQYIDLSYAVTSGIKDCERNIIAIYPDYMNDTEITLPIEALEILGSSKFENISHRDILGAIMSLGIKREKIGDIILNDGKYYCIVYSDISYYICLNLERIKHTPVEVRQISFNDVPEKKDKYKIISTNVASLRLDSVCSAGFGKSRSSISKEIQNGNVKVNWKEVVDLEFGVGEGDIISLRGKGRIVLESVGRPTKKGRINITIKKVL